MSSNPRSHATHGRVQDEQPILHGVIAGGATAADPETTIAPWGTNTIKWTLAPGFSWGSPGIEVGDGWSPEFPQPALNTADNTYSVTYFHQNTTARFYHYAVNVVRHDGFDSTGGNDPVIENQGGGGGGDDE